MSVQESVTSLASALAKAQGKFKAPIKNRKVDYQPKTGGRVKYSYADLADVIEAIREPLAENELAVYHTMHILEQGHFGLTTYIEHGPSKEKISTWYPLPDPSKNQIRAQEFGSALTYARRYSLSSLVGIASEEDDDGANAPPTDPPKTPTSKPVSAKPAAATSPNQSRPPVPPPKSNLNKHVEGANAPEDDLDAVLGPNDFDFPPVDKSGEFVDPFPSDDQPITLLDKLVTLAAEKNISTEDMKANIKRVTGANIRAKDLSSDQLEKVINYIEKLFIPKKN